jgi:putative membrane protein
MRLLAELLVFLVALLHVYILVLEMFLWTKPHGRRVFRLSPEHAAITRVLAANQGLYNGFLAAGLFWGLWLGPAGAPVQLFFLLCVAAAGIFGGLTASRRIMLVQGLPAIVAAVLLILSGPAAA